jgi:hypothetical protein
VHGTGLRLYAKEQEDSEYPRAVSAVDLAMIRPIAVGAPALVGLNDVYHSVKPAALRLREDQIPVAKAQAVTPAGVPAATPADGSAPAPAAVPATPPENLEVRKAEPVKPLDVPSGNDTPAPVDVPPPIQF